jgi:hypothetical protein
MSEAKKIVGEILAPYEAEKIAREIVAAYNDERTIYQARKSAAEVTSKALAAARLAGKLEALKEARALWVENSDDNFADELSRRIAEIEKEPRDD